MGGFGGSGFRVFVFMGFRVWGCGFQVQGVGFWGSGDLRVKHAGPSAGFSIHR